MRIKRGAAKNKKHKNVLKQAKGYRLSYSKLYRRAKETLLHAGQYSYAHRRRRKSQKRTEWIKTISAGLSGTGMSYNVFMSNLKKNNIELDRKVLAEMAVDRPESFEKLVKSVT